MGGEQVVGGGAMSLDSYRGWIPKEEKQGDLSCIVRFARALFTTLHPDRPIPNRWHNPSKVEEIIEVAVVQQKEATPPLNQPPDGLSSSSSSSSSGSRCNYNSEGRGGELKEAPQRKLFLCGDHVAANLFELKHWPRTKLLQLFYDVKIPPQAQQAPLIEPKPGFEAEDDRRRLTGIMNTTRMNLFDYRLTKGQERARGRAWRLANGWMGKGPGGGAGLLSRPLREREKTKEEWRESGSTSHCHPILPNRRLTGWKMTGVSRSGESDSLGGREGRREVGRAGSYIQDEKKYTRTE
uniref:Uncharacterized protein n=1 Tax=Chromera velia CCMP2878 TaxID=1169474 RepID=A0A0G4I708_9ALVE|eukprot:Cvel_11561.t1-p1 / transcript=Cvel_11561.t1 / gene=Cvel_11561 / organism=Chromera_velia_CCMP2878 / gene_product=hypothetical protein / transcript_product=hypothetical protein / location=Cvel_scaffold730:58037-58918(-) / protein_length=294 / sequence_SO=supercontig / SO=protein_coding / is_pseudo=false